MEIHTKGLHEHTDCFYAAGDDHDSNRDHDDRDENHGHGDCDHKDHDVFHGVDVS